MNSDEEAGVNDVQAIFLIGMAGLLFFVCFLQSLRSMNDAKKKMFRFMSVLTILLLVSYVGLLSSVSFGWRIQITLIFLFEVTSVILGHYILHTVLVADCKINGRPVLSVMHHVGLATFLTIMMLFVSLILVQSTERLGFSAIRFFSLGCAVLAGGMRYCRALYLTWLSLCVIHKRLFAEQERYQASLDRKQRERERSFSFMKNWSHWSLGNVAIPTSVFRRAEPSMRRMHKGSQSRGIPEVPGNLKPTFEMSETFQNRQTVEVIATMADGKIQGGITQQKDREECHENVREKSDGKHRERPNQISHEKLHDEKGSVMDEKVDENSQREEKEHQEKEIPSCGDERSAEDMSKKSSSRVDVTSGQLMRCLSDKVPRASRLRFARLNRSETAKTEVRSLHSTTANAKDCGYVGASRRESSRVSSSTPATYRSPGTDREGTVGGHERSQTSNAQKSNNRTTEHPRTRASLSKAKRVRDRLLALIISCALFCVVFEVAMVYGMYVSLSTAESFGTWYEDTSQQIFPRAALQFLFVGLCMFNAWKPCCTAAGG
mmetsp:Transcript_32433/g.60319  ORF Transcript_32433/g.60319 Transcript_32433/m.60319 type:complete len:548 (-) Transcript_32433:291-1934(-)